MKVQWFRKSMEIDPVRLNAELGIRIRSVRKGHIETGKIIITTDFDGNTISIPETKQGIELEFETKPTTEQLARLDKILGGSGLNYVRQGQSIRDLAKEIDELKAELQTIKNKMMAE